MSLATITGSIAVVSGAVSTGRGVSWRALASPTALFRPRRLVTASERRASR